MQKIILALISVTLLLVAAGCDSSQPATKKPGGSSSGVGTAFIGGSSAIQMEFMEGAPPVETYDGGGNNFGIAVRVENMGEANIPADKIRFTITGFDVSDFYTPASGTIAKTKLNKTIMDLQGEALSARDIDPQGNELPGGIQIVDFGNDFDYKKKLSGNIDFPIQANVCYNYETRAVSKICVEEDLLDPVAEGKVCESNENKNVESSAGPILLSSSMLESAAGSAKIQFKFDIEHTGSGSVYRRSEKVNCYEQTESRDYVKVTVETGIGGTLSCAGLDGENGQGTDSGEVKLYSGKRTISCTQDITDLGDYEKELKIKLEYDYKENLATSILVKHI
ncbi:MAG: hypothetical protein ABH879_10230 [archaeon]